MLSESKREEIAKIIKAYSKAVKKGKPLEIWYRLTDRWGNGIVNGIRVGFGTYYFYIGFLGWFSEVSLNEPSKHELDYHINNFKEGDFVKLWYDGSKPIYGEIEEIKKYATYGEADRVVKVHEVVIGGCTHINDPRDEGKFYMEKVERGEVE